MKRPARDKVPLKRSIENPLPKIPCIICKTSAFNHKREFNVWYIKRYKILTFPPYTCPYPRNTSYLLRNFRLRHSETSCKPRKRTGPTRRPTTTTHEKASELHRRIRKPTKKTTQERGNLYRSSGCRFIEEFRSEGPAGEPEAEAGGVGPHRGRGG
ncbi:hypothetical protein BHE74_00032728 [Ensete ventricosum]|nr:hypothetical protein BHE74_00032728 [Ensete ventricosum]